MSPRRTASPSNAPPRAGARAVRRVLLLILLLALPAGTVEAAQSLALWVRSADSPEPGWWQRGTGGQPGPLHQQIASALAEQAGLIVAPTRDLGDEALAPGAMPLTDEVLAELSRRIGAQAALVVELSTRPWGELESMQLHGVRAVAAVRLFEPDEGRDRQEELSADGFEGSPAQAASSARFSLCRRIAQWAALTVPAQTASAPEQREQQLLRLRGVRALEEIRQIVLRLHQGGAGLFWIAGATPGEVRLVGPLPAAGSEALAQRLQQEPYRDFTVSVSEQEGALVVRLEHPEVPVVTPGGAAGAMGDADDYDPAGSDPQDLPPGVPTSPEPGAEGGL